MVELCRDAPVEPTPVVELVETTSVAGLDKSLRKRRGCMMDCFHARTRRPTPAIRGHRPRRRDPARARFGRPLPGVGWSPSQAAPGVPVGSVESSDTSAPAGDVGRPDPLPDITWSNPSDAGVTSVCPTGPISGPTVTDNAGSSPQAPAGPCNNPAGHLLNTHRVARPHHAGDGRLRTPQTRATRSLGNWPRRARPPGQPPAHNERRGLVVGQFARKVNQVERRPRA